ncbi:helix-turn-helix transcriptional regulator [Polynucleobacter sp. es-EL-1]|uniref:helix-turn-helix domain-containing protein n=1 Tax=Polynucleobacter sp. es-EL-1 TaxID=1855652 RepID=UPI001BFCEE60|nr:helix-turn-helix transcriptional regulator [Polynucleobacter sp. es-EL-1]QWE10892.1 helix-turn-helix transcriptional regulator [Polynucleobacter sp. es-EL-1]
MITSAQIRAARALLDWSRQTLSDRSGVGISALMRLESATGIPGGNIKTFEAVQKAFEKAGIAFIGSPDDGPGVRLFIKG